MFKLICVTALALAVLSTGADAARRKKGGAAKKSGGGGGGDGPDPRMLLPFDEIDADSSKSLSEKEVRTHLMKNLDMLKEMLAGNPNVNFKKIQNKLEKKALKIFADADTSGDKDLDHDEYEVLMEGEALKKFMAMVQQEVMQAMMGGMGGMGGEL